MPTEPDTEVILFTQGLSDTCITPRVLVPKGIVTVSVGGDDYGGKVSPVRKVAEEVRKVYPDIDIVVNCKFDFYGLHHPSYNCYGVNMVGDGFSLCGALPYGLKELVKENSDIPIKVKNGQIN